MPRYIHDPCENHGPELDRKHPTSTPVRLETAQRCAGQGMHLRKDEDHGSSDATEAALPAGPLPGGREGVRLLRRAPGVRAGHQDRQRGRGGRRGRDHPPAVRRRAQDHQEKDRGWVMNEKTMSKIKAEIEEMCREAKKCGMGVGLATAERIAMLWKTNYQLIAPHSVETL